MAKNTFQKLTTSKVNLELTTNLRSYLGKKVYSKSGDIVGSVQDILLNSKHSFQGIMVKTGLRSSLFIGRKYVKELTPVSIMLSIDPVTSLVGKFVFDADGKKLGRVFELKRSSDANSFYALTIRKHRFSKPRDIPKEHIHVAKKNIILSKKYS